MRTLGDPRKALLSLVGLSIALVAALIFAVSGFIEAKDALGRIEGVEAVQLFESKAKIEAEFVGCKQNITTSKFVNRFLSGIKSDYLQRAQASEELAAFDPPGSEERKLRLGVAADLRKKASFVFKFPVKTRKQCIEERNEKFAALPHPEPSG